MNFEEWFRSQYLRDYQPNLVDNHCSLEIKRAYEAGWNACRDKWGGLEYEDKFNFD